jgi:hypothetical protein
LPALAAVVGPTTKILAIGSVTAKGTPEAIAPVLPHEVRATVRSHLAGKIEQWFFQTEGYGVVFIVNATSTAEAHEFLEKLPLGRHDGIRADRSRAARAARHAHRRTSAFVMRPAGLVGTLVAHQAPSRPLSSAS